MLWKNTKCELLLKNAQTLGVTEQGAALYDLVQRLPPAPAEIRPLFGAARQVLVLYADRKRYKAHIAAIRDYMLKGSIRCRFDALERAQDSDGPSFTQALIQLTNGEGDARSMQLSGSPMAGHYPICLLLDSDEIDLSRPRQVLAFCIGEPISGIRTPRPGEAPAAAGIA
ncbi:hypothetical protein [Marilutibacter spongiae]|uniref:Uncharacterized protein n=1 Tax=Marilutibacter spongiae TaxID=2025720 RepID=A0A7W3Y6S4_9GAMM|nr:hypothetical protein [Lysobacter spongiae]MBB1061798.1 hypothetical protein [Lysobacter spongiae]